MMMQQIRWEGSDPRSSTSSENHKGMTKKEKVSSNRSSFFSDGSNLNKSKGGNKKQNSNTTDDTNQPGKPLIITLSLTLFCIVMLFSS